MINFAEAKQRLAVNSMGLQRRDGEYRVYFPEDVARKQERRAYYTDDLDDAVLTGAMMRRDAR